MILRMTHWRAKPETDDESRRLWRTEIGAIWRGQPGLVRAHLLARTGTLDRMTFSVWRSEEDYERFLAGDDLARVVAAYEHVYEIGGAPAATEWTVLTEDWDRHE